MTAVTAVYTRPMDETPLAPSENAVLRPVAEGRWELSAGEAHFQLDEAALAVLALFDGLRTLPEVALEGRRRGLSVPPAALEGFAGALAREGLLVPAAGLSLRPRPGVRTGCACCGFCCHLPVGPLPAGEVARLEALEWADVVRPEPWRVEEGGETWLAQTADGVCCFFDSDGLCGIHRVFGEAAKPAPCRLFPVAGVRRAGALRVGLSFECRGRGRLGDAAVPLADAAGQLEPVLRQVLSSYPVLADADPGGLLAGALRGAPPPGPEAVLRRLADVAVPLLDEGSLGFDGLLADVERLGRALWEGTDNAFLAADQEPALEAVAALRRVDPAPGAAHPADRPDLAAHYVGYLDNQVFLGEPMGRLGVAAGLSLLGVAYLVARWLAQDRAAVSGRAEVSLDDVVVGISRAVGLLTCLDRIDEVAGAGARCLREAAGRV